MPRNNEHVPSAPKPQAQPFHRAHRSPSTPTPLVSKSAGPSPLFPTPWCTPTPLAHATGWQAGPVPRQHGIRVRGDSGGWITSTSLSWRAGQAVASLRCNSHAQLNCEYVRSHVPASLPTYLRAAYLPAQCP